jgi:hypothetical protein
MRERNILIALCMIIVSSCEKIINVDLNTNNPKLIVEANVTDQPGPYQVSLSHSVNYYDANNFPVVTGAHINITDNAGNSESLFEITPGKYQTQSLQGVDGRTYTLSIVTTDGNQYSAVSTMPAFVPIDSINFVPNRDSTTFRVICKFKDPEGELNYYKLQLSSNDTMGLDTTRVRIIADGFADGQELSLTYRTRLILGDTVSIRLESIDKVTYDFYRTLPNVEGGLESFASAPPANPVTNLSNGALGYFSAHSLSAVTTTVHY